MKNTIVLENNGLKFAVTPNDVFITLTVNGDSVVNKSIKDAIMRHKEMNVMRGENITRTDKIRHSLDDLSKIYRRSFCNLTKLHAEKKCIMDDQYTLDTMDEIYEGAVALNSKIDTALMMLERKDEYSVQSQLKIRDAIIEIENCYNSICRIVKLSYIKNLPNKHTKSYSLNNLISANKIKRNENNVFISLPGKKVKMDAYRYDEVMLEYKKMKKYNDTVGRIFPVWEDCKK